MALVKCRECGNDVSTQANVCPKCGAPVHGKPKQYGCGTLLLLLVVGGIVFNALVKKGADSSSSGSSPGQSGASTSASTPSASSLEDSAWTAVAVAKRKIPESLKDPDSAEFRNVFAVATPAGGVLVCGEVNAKNSFGGYTGFTKFMWNTKIAVLEEQMDAAEFVKAWNSTCAAWKTLVRVRD